MILKESTPKGVDILFSFIVVYSFFCLISCHGRDVVFMLIRGSKRLDDVWHEVDEITGYGHL